MGAISGNDLLRFGSCWALLLLWAAPEKFFPWLDRESPKDAAVSQPRPATESGDSGPADALLTLPELAPPRTERPSPDSRPTCASTRLLDSVAAGGEGKAPPDALRAADCWLSLRPVAHPRDDMAPHTERLPRVPQPLLNALSELGPPSV